MFACSNYTCKGGFALVGEVTQTVIFIYLTVNITTFLGLNIFTLASYLVRFLEYKLVKLTYGIYL